MIQMYTMVPNKVRPVILMIAMLCMTIVGYNQSPYAHLDLSASNSIKVLSESYISCGFVGPSSMCYCIDNYIESFSAVFKFEQGYASADRLGIELILDGSTYAIRVIDGQLTNESGQIIFGGSLTLSDSIKIGYYEDRVYYMHNDAIIHDVNLGAFPYSREVCLVIDQSSTDLSYYAIRGISVERNSVHFVQNTMHPQEGEAIAIQVELDHPNNTGADYVFQIRPMDATAPHFDGYDYIELRIAPGETQSAAESWTVGGPNEIADTNQVYHFDITSMTSANLDIDEEEMLTVLVVDDVYFADGSLHPGEIVFIGFDNDIGSDMDRLVLTNLVDLLPGTQFQITNARYVNDNQISWESFDPSNPIDVPVQEFTYIGTNTLASGSVICMNIPASGDLLARDFTINGGATDYFRVSLISPEWPSNINMPIGRASLLFITQGVWSIDHGDQVVMAGAILDALPYGIDWVTNGMVTDIQSNIPRDIDCFIKSDTTNIFDVPGSHWGYFDCSTIADIVFIDQYLDYIIDYDQWETGEGDPSLNLPSTVCEPSCDLLFECEELVWTVRSDDLIIECGPLGIEGEISVWLSALGGSIADCGCGERDAQVDITYQYIDPLANLCDGGDTRVEFIAVDNCFHTIRDTSVIIFNDDSPPMLFGGNDLTIYCTDQIDYGLINDWLNDYAGITAIDDCQELTWSIRLDGNLPPSCPTDQILIPVTFTVTDYCDHSDSVIHYIQIINECKNFNFGLTRSNLDLSIHSVQGCDPSEVTVKWAYRPLSGGIWTDLFNASTNHTIQNIGEYQATLECDGMCSKTKSILYDPDCNENQFDFFLEFDGQCLTITPDNSSLTNPIKSEYFLINGVQHFEESVSICGCDLYNDFGYTYTCDYGGYGTYPSSAQVTINFPPGCPTTSIIVRAHNGDFERTSTLIPGENSFTLYSASEFNSAPDGSKLSHFFEFTQKDGFFEKHTKALTFEFTKIPDVYGCPSEAVEIFSTYDSENQFSFDRDYKSFNIARVVEFENLCPAQSVTKTWVKERCNDVNQTINGEQILIPPEVSLEVLNGVPILSGCLNSENVIYAFIKREDESPFNWIVLQATNSPIFDYQELGEYKVVAYCDGCRFESDSFNAGDCNPADLSLSLRHEGDYINVTTTGCNVSNQVISWYANGTFISNSYTDLYLGHTFVPDYGEFCARWTCFSGCTIEQCITVNYDCSSNLNLKAEITPSADNTVLYANADHGCSDPSFNVSYIWELSNGASRAIYSLAGFGTSINIGNSAYGRTYRLTVKCGPCEAHDNHYIPPIDCNWIPDIFELYPDGVHTLSVTTQGCSDPSVSYQWYYSEAINPWQTLGNNKQQAVGNNGTYRVEVTCDGCTREDIISVCDAQTIDVAVNAVGSDLIANVSGCQSSQQFVWTYQPTLQDNPVTLSQTTGTLSPLSNGWYCVQVSCGGCSSGSACFNYVDCENEQLSISVQRNNFELAASVAGCSASSIINWYKEGQTGSVHAGSVYQIDPDQNGCYYAVVTCLDCEEISSVFCHDICDGQTLTPSIEIVNGGELLKVNDNHGCSLDNLTFNWYQKKSGDTNYSLFMSDVSSIIPENGIDACYKFEMICGLCTPVESGIECIEPSSCTDGNWSVFISEISVNGVAGLMAESSGCSNTTTYLWQILDCGSWQDYAVGNQILNIPNGSYRVFASCPGCDDDDLIRTYTICNGLSFQLVRQDDVLSIVNNNTCQIDPNTSTWRYRIAGSTGVGTVVGQGLTINYSQEGEYIACATCCDGCTGCSSWTFFEDEDEGDICTIEPYISFSSTDNRITVIGIGGCIGPPSYVWLRKLSGQTGFSPLANETNSYIIVDPNLEATYYVEVSCGDCIGIKSNEVNISCTSSNPSWSVNILNDNNVLRAIDNCNGSDKSYRWRFFDGSVWTELPSTTAVQNVINGGTYEVTLDCACKQETDEIDVCPSDLEVDIYPFCTGGGEGSPCTPMPDKIGAAVQGCTNITQYFWEYAPNCDGVWEPYNPIPNISSAVSSRSVSIALDGIELTLSGCYRVTVSCNGCSVTSDEYVYNVDNTGSCSQFNLTASGVPGGIRLGNLLYNGESANTFVISWTGPNNFTSGKGPLLNYSTRHEDHIIPMPAGSYSYTITHINGEDVNLACSRLIDVEILTCSFTQQLFQVKQDKSVRYFDIVKPTTNQDIRFDIFLSTGETTINAPGLENIKLYAPTSESLCIAYENMTDGIVRITAQNNSAFWSATLECSDCDDLLISINEEVATLRGREVDYNSMANQESQDDVHLYPNPSSDLINLAFKSPEKKEVQIRIYDPTGKEYIHLEREVDKGDNILTLDVRHLHSGAYILGMSDLYEHIVHKKFVIFN